MPGRPRPKVLALSLMGCLAACLEGAAQSPSNPSLSSDFTSMMQWMGGQLADGIAFNAGETFDPPHEVTHRRIQPDLSVGIGDMPFNKDSFPRLQTPALQSVGIESFFPSSVLFPNLTMHLRAGLPWRSDFALRAADMTTPSSYKLSKSLTGGGQSNSIGATLRKHCFGEDGEPLLTFGVNYNHVFGHFNYGTSFASSLPNSGGSPIPVDENITGRLGWNVNSFGFNAILSHEEGNWIPFFGAGYNRTYGSVTAELSGIDQAGGLDPIMGSATTAPEPSDARVLFGAQYNKSWADWFFNGEVKASGANKGKTWIVQTGFSLPFYIGRSRKAQEAPPNGRAAVLAPESGAVLVQ